MELISNYESLSECALILLSKLLDLSINELLEHNLPGYFISLQLLLFN